MTKRPSRAAVLAAAALGGLCFALPDLQGRMQAPAAVDVPPPRIQFVNRAQPWEWDLDGALAPSDFVRLLFRRRAQPSGHLEAMITTATRLNRRVLPEQFATMERPDLARVDLTDGGFEVRALPELANVLAGQPMYLPLLVDNRRARPVRMLVTTPAREYRFDVAATSTNGFGLRLIPPAAGAHRLPIAFEVDGQRRASMLVMSSVESGVVEVRLRDGADVLPAARIYVTGADGLAHLPAGGIQRMAWTSGEYFFHAQRSFSVALPAGQATIEAVRGIEYAIARADVIVAPNRTQTIDLPLDRRFRMADAGWYSGDAHIHANYFDSETIEAEDVHLQVAAEGLDNANLMVANGRAGVVHDARFFEGRPHRLSQGHRVLYWNEEMRNYALYGHMAFFNLKELVQPLFTGFPGTEHADDYPPNFTQAEKARAQQGAVTYVHPATLPAFNRPDVSGAKEFPIDLALGQVDALDVLSNGDEPSALKLWYHALNCGLRCTASAGTDAFTNHVLSWSLGAGRVYVHVPDAFTYAKWIDHYKQGRTFVSNGPMMTFTVDEGGPGDTLKFPAGRRMVRIRATARSAVPMDHLQIVVNGSVVALQRASGDRLTIRLDEEIPLDRSAWVAARVTGPSHRLVMNDAQLFAHTSPVYCYLGNQPIASAIDAAFWVDWIEQLIAEVRRRGVFSTPDKLESVVKLFRQGQDYYRRMANPVR